MLFKKKIFFCTSGTLGNHWDKQFLKEKLNLESFPIPSHKESRVVYWPTKILLLSIEWKSAIINEVKEFVKQGRALLIICRDINTAIEIHEQMTKDASEAKIIKYWRNDIQALPDRVNLKFKYLHTYFYVTLNPTDGKKC